MLPQRFPATYLGQFASRNHYTRRRMVEQGWTDILHTQGMDPYFDVHRYERHLFCGEVSAVDRDGWQPGRGIEVFGRRPTST
jgi:hypothetical protein